MRTWIACLLAVSCLSSAQAHHPDRESQPVRRRIDVIGPIGNQLPMEHRRRFNRPTNLGGKIAYHIAPSSQEAMRWHKATHQGQYKCDAPRMVANYFYPKPWEAIRIGARPNRDFKPEKEEPAVASMSDTEEEDQSDASDTTDQSDSSDQTDPTDLSFPQE